MFSIGKKKTQEAPPAPPDVEIAGSDAIAKTVVEVPTHQRLDYLRKICTFTLKKAEVDKNNCCIQFSCEQDIPWERWKSEATLSINLPAEYIHMVSKDIKAGVRIRMTVEPIPEGEEKKPQ